MVGKKKKNNFELKLDCERVLFKSFEDVPGSFTINIMNPLEDRVSYKVKCSSNTIFLIKKVFGILEPEESINVMIFFIPEEKTPQNGKHFFSIHYIRVGDVKLNDEHAIRDLWKGVKGPGEGAKRIYVDFDRKRIPKEMKDAQLAKIKLNAQRAKFLKDLDED
ncbi:unnamed protein product [Caenorhabditis sp. 36 PRJEB53466]|nr:unnamed protein product [Caenorhabditis sp. 36 PRJEB53466]